MQKFLIIPSDLKGGPAQYQTEAIAADFMLFKYSCACLRGVAEIITFALPTVFPDARTVQGSKLYFFRCTNLFAWFSVIFLLVHNLNFGCTAKILRSTTANVRQELARMSILSF